MTDVDARYHKQALFAGIGPEGQEKLQQARVAVVGCGALGSVIAETLARSGVGTLRLIDRDFVELSNLQRQVLFDEQDVADRLPKAVAATRKLERINHLVRVEPHVADLTFRNALSLLAEVDLILDGTDNFEVRFLINDVALEAGTPWINGGCVGSHGQVMLIDPGRTPCLRCLMEDVPEAGSTETCDTAGVIGPAVNVVASLQCVTALQWLVGGSELVENVMTVIDVWEGTWRRMGLGNLRDAVDCPACKRGERRWLHGSAGATSTVLCGRNAVQVTPQSDHTIDLASLSTRLRSAGTVRETPFLIMFRPADVDCEFTVFPDGRAIIQGTEETSVARTLYARFIGQ